MEKQSDSKSGAEKKDSEFLLKQTQDNHDGKLRVIIIGGSIGGLCCAHALLKSGVCNVIVLEKVRTVAAAGAGLGIDELSCAALEDWGLRDELFRFCKPLDSEETELAGLLLSLLRGAVLMCHQIRAVDRERGVSLTICKDEQLRHIAVYWSELHRILYDALPSGIVHLGHEVLSLEENEEISSIKVSVSVVAQEGQPANMIAIDGDLVVAADGSMSHVRQRYSPTQKKRYSGYCAWRGLLDYTNEPEVISAVKEEFSGIGETLYFELAPGTHSVLYELTGNRLNWLWYVNQPEPELKGNSLTKHPDSETIAAMHQAADRTWGPGLAKLMKETPKPFINAIYDREPLKQFAWGRVVLVGEAAHPTTPHGLRSTNMSIVDAHVLGKAVQNWGPHNVNAALAEYDSARLSNTSQQVLFSRYLGQVKQGLSLEPKGSFPWPTAEFTTKEGLLMRNMHSFQWKE